MYIVICTRYEGNLPTSQSIYGPFGSQAAAEAFQDWDFMRVQDWDFMRVAVVEKPPPKPQIHPNQAAISDYIDPSVAN